MVEGRLMYYAISNDVVIDVQDQLIDYGPDVFGNPIEIIETDEDIPLGTKYDHITESFILKDFSLSPTSSEADSNETILEEEGYNDTNNTDFLSTD